MNDDLNIFNLYLEAASSEEPMMKVYSNGYKMWQLRGNLHREDGPAVEYANGSKAWYLNGKIFSMPEKWAANVLVKHGKPHDDESVNEFLKQILKKDIEEAL